MKNYIFLMVVGLWTASVQCAESAWLEKNGGKTPLLRGNPFPYVIRYGEKEEEVEIVQNYEVQLSTQKEAGLIKGGMLIPGSSLESKILSYTKRAIIEKFSPSY